MPQLYQKSCQSYAKIRRPSVFQNKYRGRFTSPYPLLPWALGVLLGNYVLHFFPQHQVVGLLNSARECVRHSLLVFLFSDPPYPAGVVVVVIVVIATKGFCATKASAPWLASVQPRYMRNQARTCALGLLQTRYLLEQSTNNSQVRTRLGIRRASPRYEDTRHRMSSE